MFCSSSFDARCGINNNNNNNADADWFWYFFLSVFCLLYSLHLYQYKFTVGVFCFYKKFNMQKTEGLLTAIHRAETLQK